MHAVITIHVCLLLRPTPVGMMMLNGSGSGADQIMFQLSYLLDRSRDKEHARRLIWHTLALAYTHTHARIYYITERKYLF